jgi:alkanesulfonate monooxygenase SsuD/methylene tetrahydromethanopterin reductase-like flavin-dependent oxidoreductase (luciferase family)
MNERVAHLRENVAVMRSLWASEDVAYEGRYRLIEHGTMSPRPKQLSAGKTGVPLWFGGGSEPMLRRLAEIADGWVGSGGAPAENFVSGVESIKEFAKEKGRDPGTLGFGKLINVSVAETKSKAFDLAKEHWGEYYGPNFDVDKSAIYGEPEAVRAGLREFGEVDTPEVTLILEPSSLDLAQLELLAKTTENLMS